MICWISFFSCYEVPSICNVYLKMVLNQVKQISATFRVRVLFFFCFPFSNIDILYSQFSHYPGSEANLVSEVNWIPLLIKQYFACEFTVSVWNPPALEVFQLTRKSASEIKFVTDYCGMRCKRNKKPT